MSQFDVLTVFRYLHDRPPFKEQTLAQVREDTLVCSILDTSGRLFGLWRWFRDKKRKSKYGIYDVMSLNFLCTKNLARSSQLTWSVSVAVEHYHDDTQICTRCLIDRYQQLAQLNDHDVVQK